MVSGQNSNCGMAMNVWVPLSNAFRQAIQHATETAFVGRRSITTVSGETVPLDDVLRYNQKAEGPLVSTFRRLESIGRTDVVNLIQRLYPLLLPYLIGCGTANPVHHTAYVMEFMATILIGEGKTAKKPKRRVSASKRLDDVTIGMLAALFHDMAQGFSKLPKITEAHIQDKVKSLVAGTCTLDDLEAYRNNAVKGRQEHMTKGAEKTAEMIQQYRRSQREVSNGEIAEIRRIIEHHDDPKIPIVYKTIPDMFRADVDCRTWLSQAHSGKDEKQLESILNQQKGDRYLLKVKDWRLQYLHEADLLWMVTQDGIEADLARFSPAQKEQKTWRGMIDHNVKQHHKEAKLYRDRGKSGDKNAPRFSEYGFQKGTAYRTKTGYALFEYLTGILRERYP